MRHEDEIHEILPLSSLLFLQNQKSKLNTNHDILTYCYAYSTQYFRKTIWSIQLDVFFNYESFPLRLIITERFPSHTQSNGQ